MEEVDEELFKVLLKLKASKVFDGGGLWDEDCCVDDCWGAEESR